MKRIKIFTLFFISVAMALAGCTGGGAEGGSGTDRIVLAAYTTPREAYGQLIPLFQSQWLAETGRRVVFEESYLGSGAQSRAVVEGFEADIVALSLAADVNRIKQAGLITHDWQQNDHNGFVTTSVVAFAVRKGNPLQIQDWSDLRRPGIEILTPNPKMSGGAMWNILGAYGAALRGQIDGIPGEDPEAAMMLLKDILRNVSVMDQSARDSIVNYEMGIGDLAITYENEVLVGMNSGQDYELILPASTILIENPIAIVDVNVDKHGSREVTEAFLDFLLTPEAQAIFAQHGLRVVNPEAAAASAEFYPEIDDLFTVDFFVGWDQVMIEIFGDGGLYDQVLLQVHRR